MEWLGDYERGGGGAIPHHRVANHALHVLLSSPSVSGNDPSCENDERLLQRRLETDRRRSLHCVLSSQNFFATPPLGQVHGTQEPIGSSSSSPRRLFPSDLYSPSSALVFQHRRSQPSIPHYPDLEYMSVAGSRPIRHIPSQPVMTNYDPQSTEKLVQSPSRPQRQLVASPRAQQWQRSAASHLSFSASSVYSPVPEGGHRSSTLYQQRMPQSGSPSAPHHPLPVGGKKFPTTMEKRILKRCHHSDLSHRFQRHSQELQCQLSARGSVGTNSNESTPSRTEGGSDF